MSLSDQKRFLRKFDEELRKSSKAYRKAKADQQHHSFTVSKTAIIRGITDTIRRGLAGNKNAEKIISKILLDLYKDIEGAIDSIAKNVANKIEGDSVVTGEVVAYDKGNRFVAWFAASQQEPGKFRSVYKQVYRSYDKILDNLAKRVSEVSKEVAGVSFGEQAKNYFNLEHGKFKGVAESFAKDAMVEALLETTSIGEADVLEWLRRSGIDIRIIRNTKTDRMEVFIGSKFANLEEGDLSKDRLKQLKEIAADARAVVESTGAEILGLPGSPSFVDIKRKKLLKKVAKEFESIKNVQVKIGEKLDVKGQKTPVESKSKQRKTKKAAAGFTKGKGGMASPRRVKKGVASSPLQLIAIINSKLPKTVAENMQYPRLQYQTGRFASSVRVTDVNTTAQGFPSIGYTYQKFPYQTFEPGYAQGSVERDPRRLIDTSIRQIAAELALGRFYTRRV